MAIHLPKLGISPYFDFSFAEGIILSRGKKLEQKLYINKIFGQILLKQVSSKILIPQRRFHNRQITPHL